ncbi:MAG: 1-deoxy-D-xylulose-5-phosphate reductoisomerase [Ruminococcaceae bacterium]|nr:1-deoxy-D-xylulose-5-phosphate reductoisomerase [Oscillospiraceae bacterium]
MKRITILGSTGSIGTQTLEVAEHLGNVEVVGLSAHSNVTLLAEQARKFGVTYACVADESKYHDLKTALADTNIEVSAGMEALCALSARQEADTVVTSIVGNAGLLPTVSAIRAGRRIALANKETLVTAGELVMPLARECGVDILPVDSEHGAIFQCFQGENPKTARRILLTCSGGPFYGKTRAELKGVTRADALRHPNWAMGAKITIDSATLMNKGLEVIEAHWLFDMPVEDVTVVVHRQSIIHSAVEFVDGSVMAQMGTPDMRLPISYAITYPERTPSCAKPLDLFSVGELTFAKPDTDTFGCLNLAYEASRIGGTCPAVMNGANEAAVALFLEEKIGFLDIADLVGEAMARHIPCEVTIENILAADREGRDVVVNLYQNRRKA